MIDTVALLRSIGSPPLESDHTIINTGRSNNVESASSSRPQLSVTAPKSSMNQIFRLKDVHLMAAFLLVYVGVEVTIGGKQSLVPFFTENQPTQVGLSPTLSTFAAAAHLLVTFLPASLEVWHLVASHWSGLIEWSVKREWCIYMRFWLSGTFGLLR